MKLQDLLEKIVRLAQACQRVSGIPASCTIAHTPMESSWRALGSKLVGMEPDSA